MSFPLVAIVILNYNGRNFLEKFLPSVIASIYPNKKIIVADNASTDDSVPFVNTNFKEAEMLLLDKNYGFAGGYNKALQMVEADYFILLNSDVEVSPGWVEPMITLMEANTGIAACQPKILSYYKKDFFEYAGACGGWIDTLGYAFARGRVFDVCEEDKGQYNNIAQVFWATGAALCIRANCFKEAGGFDSYFFAHMEEIDLCWRLQRKGYTIFCCPSSVVYHVGGGTLPKTNSRKTFLNFRNNLIMLFKNLSFGEAVWKIPLRIILDWVFAFKSLLQKDRATFKAVFNAHAAVVKWIGTSKDHQKLPAAGLKRLGGVYKGWLINAYFFKQKKHFSEIVNGRG